MEAIARDYAPRGVRFYYIYKSLAHPVTLQYVQPLTLKERLMHVKEAEQRIGGTIPWLCDTMANDVMHALGSAPTSEFVIDPSGRVVHKRVWGDPGQLRRDLEELVGKVDNPTGADDVDIDIVPLPQIAARGVVEEIKVPNAMIPLVSRPVSKRGDLPYYVKLRADTDESLFDSGTGKMYLGFHLDPIYRVHWNNLTKPIHVEIELPDGVTMPTTLDGPSPKTESDVDPREFLVDVAGWTSDVPIRLKVDYFGCSDDPAFCVPVTQRYIIYRTLDRDSGWASDRIEPTGPFQSERPKVAEGRVVKMDPEAGKLVIKTPGGTMREFHVTRFSAFFLGSERRQLGELKEGTELLVEYYNRQQGPFARNLRAISAPVEP